VKAGDGTKSEANGVKAEPMDGLDAKLEDLDMDGRGRLGEDGELEEEELEEDPISYDQYYPVMLPHR
jgi:hypothetical protein